MPRTDQYTCVTGQLLVSADVDGHDRPGLIRNRGLDGRGRYVHRVGIDVNEDRDSVRLHYRTCGGDERIRRHDHLVAGLDADGLQRNNQRNGAIGNADAVLCALILGELLLELTDLCPANIPPMPAANDIRDGLAIGLVPYRPFRPGPFANLGAAVDG